MADLTADKAKAQLDGIRAAMHEQYPDNTARLEQLDAHIATVAMVVDHLFDEAERMSA